MPEHDTHITTGFVRASELYHVERSNRIAHPAKQASDDDIAAIFDFDTGGNNAD